MRYMKEGAWYVFGRRWSSLCESGPPNPGPPEREAMTHRQSWRRSDRLCSSLPPTQLSQQYSLIQVFRIDNV